MAKQFYPELSPAERLVLLRDNADKSETTTYFKTLTQDELDERRESLAENSIKLSELEDSKKLTSDRFKAQMDPLKAANKILLGEIKTKQAEVEGELFHIADHDAGIMETYDANGDLHSSRRLKPDEKQQKLFPVRKAQ